MSWEGIERGSLKVGLLERECGGGVGRGVWEGHLGGAFGRGVWEGRLGGAFGRGVWEGRLGVTFGRGVCLFSSLMENSSVRLQCNQLLQPL